MMQGSREMEIRDGNTATTKQSTRAAVLWGVVVGGIQAASPLAFWWLTPATVYALELALIAAVYIGFAVADGRRQVIAVECCVAATLWCLPLRRSREQPGFSCWAMQVTGPRICGSTGADT
jgi:hypothetical protein